MFPLLPFPGLKDVLLFGLVLTRIAGIFTALPVFGGRRVPARVRILLVVMITLTCFPVLKLKAPEIPTDAFSLAMLVLRELMVGITLSFITQLIFSAVEFAGQIVGLQMGFTMSSLLDPMMGNQAQIMSVVYTLFATLMFLSLNIHHLFIRAIVDSFALIPVGGWLLSGETVSFLVRHVADIFTLGVRLAAPVMVALLLTSVTLGIMARAFPQMNVFMVSFPLNIGIGFFIIGSTLMLFFHVLEVSFGNLRMQMDELFRLMAKG